MITGGVEDMPGGSGGCRTVISGFLQDPNGDWVAELACGHAEHVGDQSGVESATARAAKLGMPIACPSCEMPALPENAQEARRSSTFTQDNVPAGLLRDHGTKPGVWALIIIEAGRLDYTFESPLRTFLLTPERPGVIPPEVPHHVTVIGPVQFYLSFMAPR
jgi:tellurite methyltransferase